VLERCLRRFFPENGLPEWEQEIAVDAQRNAQGRNDVTRLDLMVRLYMDRFVLHDREHYMRIASALPLLQMLATGEARLLLAPKAEDFDDEREIQDIDMVIKQKTVLYRGLDSLSNNIVQQAIASMVLSDVAAVCGAIYDFYAKPPEVVLIIDEMAEAINEQVIQILNKGRGAGFKAIVAFRALADLEAKLGNAAKMLRVLGNLNNQINDWKTATPPRRDAAKTVAFVT